MEIIDFEPIKGCKHPLIAPGATPIGSASRAPDEIKRKKRDLKLFVQVPTKEDKKTR
jgi:hypothetical protein